jgi:hypothetical protein
LKSLFSYLACSLVVSLLVLTGCSSAPSSNGALAPASSPQLPQLDPAKVSYFLQAVGCFTAEAAAIAAPVIAVEADGQGNAVLAATAKGATTACTTTVPIAAVAVASAPAATPAAPATPASSS